MSKRCYYDGDSCNYEEGLWQCKTCKEWYCYNHNHDTMLGYCVECCVCEKERLRMEHPDYFVQESD